VARSATRSGIRRAFLVTLLGVAACVFIPQASAGTKAPSRALTCPTDNTAIINSTLTVHQGGTATATFQIAPGCSNIQVNLASYDAPSAGFGLPQTLIDYSAKPLNGSVRYSYNGGATYTLTTNVSPCFFQVDLVRGPVIVNLTSTDQYLDRKLLWENGGTACADRTPPQCSLTTTIKGPPKQIQVTVQDAESGLQSVDYNVKNGSVAPDAGPFTTNADGSVSGSADFTVPTFTPLVLTVTKTNQALSSRVIFTVNNRNGLKTTCDPVVPAAVSVSPFDALAQLVSAATQLI
jgi:hypothetical protein